MHEYRALYYRLYINYNYHHVSLHTFPVQDCSIGLHILLQDLPLELQLSESVPLFLKHFKSDLFVVVYRTLLAVLLSDQHLTTACFLVLCDYVFSLSYCLTVIAHN